MNAATRNTLNQMRQNLEETIDQILTNASDELADDDTLRMEIAAALIDGGQVEDSIIEGIDERTFDTISGLIADWRDDTNAVIEEDAADSRYEQRMRYGDDDRY